MELRQFRHFIAVAEELSFRKAAKRLNMAQPPLTASIKRIEEELGVMLIERTNRITQLTPAGRSFLEEAARTVRQAERAISTARNAANGLSGILRVTYLASAMSTILPPILRDFRKAFPDVGLDLEELPNHQQVSALLEERADIGFLVFPFQLPDEITAEVLFRDEFVVALPPGHPLASLHSIRLSMLTSDQWIVFPRRQAPALYDDFHAACMKAGFTPAISLEAHGAQAQIGLVSAGLGVAIVPESFCTPHRRNVVFRRLTGDGTPINYELAMACNSKTPLRQAFVSVARANRQRGQQD